MINDENGSRLLIHLLSMSDTQNENVFVYNGKHYSIVADTIFSQSGELTFENGKHIRIL